MARVLIFGASITYGAWDKEGGWVERLKEFLHEKTLTEERSDFQVYNLGISGDTTEDVLERFEFETKQRQKEKEELVILFSIGINDSQFILAQNGPRVPAEKFKENIQKLINLSQQFTKKVIFVGFIPVDESQVDPIPWKPTHSYKNEYIEKFDNIVKEICNKNKIPFIEIFNKFKERDFTSLLEDGVHPNSKGHQKIFMIVKNFLIENKII